MEIEIVVYATSRAAIDAILILNPDTSKLTKTKLEILFLPLNLKPECAMPIRKSNMVLNYDTWKNVPPPNFDTDGIVEKDGVAEEYSATNKDGVAEEDMTKTSLTWKINMNLIRQ